MSFPGEPSPMGEGVRVDAANIVHETVEGEVGVVELDSGTYYSLDAVGAEIWDHLIGGSTLDALADFIASRYGADRRSVAHGVSEFLRHLVNEKLVVAAPGANGARPDPREAPAIPYADPVLHKYSDMEELLLVDPIHEVEDSGWPNAR